MRQTAPNRHKNFQKRTSEQTLLSTLEVECAARQNLPFCGSKQNWEEWKKKRAHLNSQFYTWLLLLLHLCLLVALLPKIDKERKRKSCSRPAHFLPVFIFFILCCFSPLPPHSTRTQCYQPPNRLLFKHTHKLRLRLKLRLRQTGSQQARKN